MRYQDFSNLSVKWVDPSITSQMIIKHHYTHMVSVGIVVSLGIFENDKLMGCILYTPPKYPQVYAGISPLITNNNEVLELTRLFIFDTLKGNTETWLIGKSFRFIEQYHKNVKVLLSYSDTGQKHFGGIYQGTNWYYLGLTRGDGSEIYIINGKRLTLRAIRHRFGEGINGTELKAMFPTLEIVPSTQKHIYVLPIGNKFWEQRLINSLYDKPRKYPKDQNQIVVIE